MSTPKAVRHINQARVLNALFTDGPMSRASLARQLGMTRATAGNLVRALEDGGAIAAAGDRAGEEADRSVGRPGTLLDLEPGHAYFAGLDFGVGYVSGALIDLKARCVAKAWLTTDARAQTPDLSVGLALDALDRMVADVGIDASDVRRLCLSVAGLVDRGGVVMRAPILRWHDAPLMALMEAARPGLPPITVENDANAFAFSETYLSPHESRLNGLFVWLDAGVGGGIVLDGQLLRGVNGYAGEIGHIFIGENAVDSGAPLPGTLESFVGCEALLARNRYLGGEARTLDDFLAELAAGAGAARKASETWTLALGRGLATLVSVLNPAQIVLGGPVSLVLAHQRPGAPTVEDAMRACLLLDTPIPPVRLSRTGSDAVARGAAFMMHKAYLEIDETIVFGRSQ